LVAQLAIYRSSRGSRLAPSVGT